MVHEIQSEVELQRICWRDRKSYWEVWRREWCFFTGIPVQLVNFPMQSTVLFRLVLLLPGQECPVLTVLFLLAFVLLAFTAEETNVNV